MKQSARATFESFLRQMCDWEVKYAALDTALEDDFDAWQDMRQEARNARRLILQTYCDASLLNDEMLDACDFETPSEYDPERDEILEMGRGDGREVFDYRQTAGLKAKYRFTLTSTEGLWRITKAEWRRNRADTETWESLFI
jgi:hypothetical protein